MDNLIVYSLDMLYVALFINKFIVLKSKLSDIVENIIMESKNTIKGGRTWGKDKHIKKRCLGIDSPRIVIKY